VALEVALVPLEERLREVVADASYDLVGQHVEDNPDSRGVDLDAFGDDSRLGDHHVLVEELHGQRILDSRLEVRSCDHLKRQGAAEEDTAKDMKLEDGARKELLLDSADLEADRLAVDSLPFSVC
jgi:hypothetical protein